MRSASAKRRYYAVEQGMSQGPPAAEQIPSVWGAVRAGASRSLAPLRNFLFPPACLACGDSIAEARPLLCPPCRVALCAPAGSRCLRCAAPVGPHLDTSNGCSICRQESFAFRRVLALGVYDDRLRAAIIRGKQPHGGPLVAALADLLVDTWIADLLTEPFDVVVPVPHDWRRRFWRMHNSAETLAEQVARRLQRPCVLHALRKPKPTPSQSAAPPSVRRTQQRGAFVASATVNLSGARILLVDDVLTTGATAQAAAQALRELQPADVFVAVLARGLGHGHVRS